MTYINTDVNILNPQQWIIFDIYGESLYYCRSGLLNGNQDVCT